MQQNTTLIIEKINVTSIKITKKSSMNDENTKEYDINHWDINHDYVCHVKDLYNESSVKIKLSKVNVKENDNFFIKKRSLKVLDKNKIFSTEDARTEKTFLAENDFGIKTIKILPYDILELWNKKRKLCKLSFSPLLREETPSTSNNFTRRVNKKIVDTLFSKVQKKIVDNNIQLNKRQMRLLYYPVDILTDNNDNLKDLFEVVDVLDKKWKNEEISNTSLLGKLAVDTLISLTDDKNSDNNLKKIKNAFFSAVLDNTVLQKKKQTHTNYVLGAL